MVAAADLELKIDDDVTLAWRNLEYTVTNTRGDKVEVIFQLIQLFISVYNTILILDGSGPRWPDFENNSQILPSKNKSV